MAHGAFFPPSYPRNSMVVTFLGTTSGGGPTDTRNCSSLVVDAVGNGQLWSTSGATDFFVSLSAPSLTRPSSGRLCGGHCAPVCDAAVS